MTKHQPFVIPSGVRFDITEKGVIIEHAGDVILHGALKKNLESVTSREGSIILRGDFEVNTLDAPQGTVRMEGSVKATKVTGASVEIVGPKFQAKAVWGERQIVVGPTRITADVLVAPRVDINPKASGRIPVVDCHNDLGATAIKGCFSLKEYEELIGNAAAFLAERGVTPLIPSAGSEDQEEDAEEEHSGAIIEAQGADDAPAPTGVEEAVEDPDTYPGAVAQSPHPAGFQVKVEVPVTFEAEAGNESPILGDQVSATIPEEDLLDNVEPMEAEPVEVAEMPDDEDLPEAEPSPGPATVRVSRPVSAPAEVEPAAPGPVVADDPTYGNLVDTLRSLAECYEGADEPPVIGELRVMVEKRDYENIRVRLPHIWNELVKYHREKGLRIRRQVTTTFNSIMNLVKNTAPTA